MSDWQPAIQLINSWQPLSNALWQQFKELVQNSHAHLKPLGEPFYLDLQASRLFSDVREETYSNWLAWILTELSSRSHGTAGIFKLLSIKEQEFSECPKIFRELHIEQGHEGLAGRLDILILYKVRKLLIHTEVKVTKAEGADLVKNRGYMQSLKGRHPDITNQIHVLLVTDAPYSIHDGFIVLTWCHVSKVLRQLAVDPTISRENTLLSAIMLLFAGVVEQTLYKFPCLSVHESPLGLPSTQAITYLKESLPQRKSERGTTMPDNDKEIEQSRQQFIKDGGRNYMEALSAIGGFNAELWRRSEEVVKKRRVDLASAFGPEFQLTKIEKYEYANLLPTNSYETPFAWVTSKITMSPYLVCHFGIRWTGRTLCVVVMMDPGNAPRRKFLMGKIRECGISRKMDNLYNYEVAIIEEIDADRLKDFEKVLNQLIDDWVQVWKSIGGLGNLTVAGTLPVPS